MKSIPIIDFRFEQDCIEKMYVAYTTCGFAIFTHVYDNWLSEFQDWKLLMEEFFQLEKNIKEKSEKFDPFSHFRKVPNFSDFFLYFFLLFFNQK